MMTKARAVGSLAEVSLKGIFAAADRSGVGQAPAEDCYMQSLDVRMVGQAASYPVGDDERDRDDTTSSADSIFLQ